MSAFDALLEGYRRFRSTSYAAERARWDALAQGQSPKVMVIGCCDSRVEPTRIFDAGPGELFVLRNVANLVPPYEPDSTRHSASAAIEFAVLGLQVEHILVLGHAQCGGVAAALSGVDLGAPGVSFIDRWMSILDAEAELVRAAAAADASIDAQRALELAGVRVSVRNLRTFPYVAERETAGALTLHGAHFGIGNGELRVMQDDEFAAVPLG